jgi:hypothetical protein
MFQSSDQKAIIIDCDSKKPAEVRFARSRADKMDWGRIKAAERMLWSI